MWEIHEIQKVIKVNFIFNVSKAIIDKYQFLQVTQMDDQLPKSAQGAIQENADTRVGLFSYQILVIYVAFVMTPAAGSNRAADDLPLADLATVFTLVIRNSNPRQS